MRRLLPPGDQEGLFHVTSRVVDKRLIFGDAERAHFFRLARDLAEFGGLDLISWALMGNHFHLLVRVPPAESAANVAEAELVRRLPLALPPHRVEMLRKQLSMCRSEDSRRELLAPFRARLASLPDYMKILKHRFSVWYNRRNERTGTLWENRYHSVLLEHVREPAVAAEQGLGPVARVIAAYIDLNPVRAKLADTPDGKDWTSYSAACRGNPVAVRGLALLWGEKHGSEHAWLEHRRILSVEGSAWKVPQGGPKSKRGAIRTKNKSGESAIGPAVDVQEVPKVTVEAWARAKILGSAEFVASVFGPETTSRDAPSTGTDDKKNPRLSANSDCAINRGKDGRRSRVHALDESGLAGMVVYPCPRRLAHRE